ncbi:J domain-containing protein [Marmoricola sp. RAF53]|uniref:J domain-containing protein n=1 Tax=Marmoricola sp. RAF53 TaxID=3233059 RepID=UPI003F9725D9
MTTTPNPGPTWYDLLGVAPDATPDEIKAAWRHATDKFEPGSGTSQFRLFNEAADVLLDPVKRNRYDAELAGGTTAGAVDLAKTETPAAPAADDEDSDEPVGADGAVEAVAADEIPAEEPAGESSGLVGRLGRVSNLVLAVLVVVALASLAAVLVLAGNIKSRTDVADAGPEASAAASRALTSVLAYDYRHMDADRDRAAKFMTPDYRKEYLKTFGLLTKGADGQPGPAVKTKTVVTSDVLGTGVVDAEKDKVRVVVFVNQSSVKGDANPAIFQNRVVATMVKDGDRWLLDGVQSY